MIFRNSLLTRILFLAVLLVPFTGIGCGEDEQVLQWQLIWEDEFDGPAGQLPDPAHWGFDTGVDWGNAQLEYDTDRPENVSLDGQGNLAITARRETYTGPKGTREFTSGRINTLGRFEQSGGRFEARIRLPIGQGIWPAFWMLGNDFSRVGWPDCGEIDIMEYRGQVPNVVMGTIHGPGYSGGSGIGGSFNLGASFHDDFHVFAVEWTQDGITWLVDGQPFRTVTPANIPRGTSWVFDHPFGMLLNVAVGGNFTGCTDPDCITATFPQTMLVDWVRVYGFAAASKPATVRP